MDRDWIERWVSSCRALAVEIVEKEDYLDKESFCFGPPAASEDLELLGSILGERDDLLLLYAVVDGFELMGVHEGIYIGPASLVLRTTRPAKQRSGQTPRRLAGAVSAEKVLWIGGNGVGDHLLLDLQARTLMLVDHENYLSRDGTLTIERAQSVLGKWNDLQAFLAAVLDDMGAQASGDMAHRFIGQ